MILVNELVVVGRFRDLSAPIWTAGRRFTLLISGLLHLCLANPTDLTAQTRADRESVARVVELLLISAGEFENEEVAYHPGGWGLVIARFAKGDMREIEIPANSGEIYQVMGASELDGTDVDICVYAPGGDRLNCDTLEDNIPVVGFTATTDGIYRAVMSAASVEQPGTSYAGMVVLRIAGEAEGLEEGSHGNDAKAERGSDDADEKPIRPRSLFRGRLSDHDVGSEVRTKIQDVHRVRATRNRMP